MAFAIPSSGLQGNWPFNGSGNDASGNGFDFTVDASNWVAGVIDQAAGPGSDLTVSEPVAILAQIEYQTIFCRFKIATGATESWISFSDSDREHLYIGFKPDGGSAVLELIIDAVSVNMETAPIAYDEWHTLVAVWDGSAGIFFAYVDGGDAQTQETSPDLLGEGDDIVMPLNAGVTVDHLAAWDRVLTPSEIAALAESPAAGGGESVKLCKRRMAPALVS